MSNLSTSYEEIQKILLAEKVIWAYELSLIPEKEEEFHKSFYEARQIAQRILQQNGMD